VLHGYLKDKEQGKKILHCSLKHNLKAQLDKNQSLHVSSNCVSRILERISIDILRELSRDLLGHDHIACVNRLEGLFGDKEEWILDSDDQFVFLVTLRDKKRLLKLYLKVHVA
jgi:hypothetical protein